MSYFRNILLLVIIVPLVACISSPPQNKSKKIAIISDLQIDEYTHPKFRVRQQSGTIGQIKTAGKNVFLNGENIRGIEGLQNDDVVTTESDSAALIQIFQTDGPCKIKVTDFSRGKLYAYTNRCDHEVKTRHSVLEAEAGDTEYHIKVRRKATTISVFSGSVVVWPKGDPSVDVRLSEGTEVRITRERIETKKPISREQIRNIIRWQDRYEFPRGRYKLPSSNTKNSNSPGTAAKILMGIGAGIIGVMEIYNRSRDSDKETKQPSKNTENENSGSPSNNRTNPGPEEKPDSNSTEDENGEDLI